MSAVELLLLVVIGVMALAIVAFLAWAWIFAIRDALLREDRDILVRLLWVGVMIVLPIVGTWIYLYVGRPDAGASFLNRVGRLLGGTRTGTIS